MKSLAEIMEDGDGSVTEAIEAIKAGADVSGTPLHEYVHAAIADVVDEDLFHAFFAAGGDVNAMEEYTNNTLLHQAFDDEDLCAANESFVRLLIEAGADVNARNRDGYTPLILIRRIQNHPEYEDVYDPEDDTLDRIAKLLIEHGAK